MDFLKNLTHDEHHTSDAKSYDETPVPATKRGDSGDNIIERFADKLNLSDAAKPAPPPPVPEHKSLFDKLGDAVDGLGGRTPPPPPPAPEKSENIFEKIGDALKGEKKSPPPPPQPEGLFDKISDVLHGGKHEEAPKPQTLGDKFNNMLGGGASSEAKEDSLDKAIDLAQEHLLKQGEQQNESVVEQLKDKQIAGAIRHGFESLTGKRN